MPKGIGSAVRAVYAFDAMPANGSIAAAVSFVFIDP